MMTEQEHNNIQWRKVKLGKVGEIISGGTPSTTNETFWDGDVLFVTPLDLGRKNKIDSTLRTISELGVKNSSANKIKAHSLAISTRAPIGLMSIVNHDFTTNQGCKSIQFYDSYDSEFFYYYLSYNVEKIQRYGQGTTFMEISKTDFSNLEFTVPDLSAQRRIAAILTSADKVIAATQKTIAKYKQIKQGMMEDLLKPKEGWKMVKLGEVGEIVTGLTYSPSNVRQEGVLVLRSSNIQDDNLCFEDNVYVDVESFNPVIENDILICVRNGSRALIGKTARITKEVEGCSFGAFMLVYRSSYNDFLYHFFKSDMFFSQVSRNIGATINSINGSDLKNMEVNMPSDPTELRRIAKILSGIDAKIAAEEKVLEKYTLVKKGLMEKLLNEKF